MSRYTFEFKLEAVRMVTMEHRTVHEVARVLGVHISSLQTWLKLYRYHGESGLEKQSGEFIKNYNGEFMVHAIEDMYRHSLSYREAAAKHGIRSHAVLARWEKIYKERGRDYLLTYKPARRGRKKKNPNLSQVVYDSVIEENKRLKMEVEYLKKLSALTQKRD